MNKTQAMYRRAREIIPGGVQLLSKRPEMMAPGVWPAYYQKAKGCEVTDLDGKRYLDFSTNGIGACLLGFANEAVSEAVARALADGSMCTLNPYEEVELAEALLAIHPWAGGVRFARTGGETAAVAVRIARAYNRRDRVAVCGYHGWSDWYIAANLGDSENLRGMLLPGLDAYGVPGQLRGSTLTFDYGDFEGFEALIRERGDELACIVMEPVRHHPAAEGFLELIRKRCSEKNIVLIFDEITIGFRYTYGGSHLRLGVTPDIAIFAKALGNGHPIGAIVGEKEVMSAAQRSFISSTYWTERIGPAAAVAVLRELKTHRVAEHVNRIGADFMTMLKRSAARHGIRIVNNSEFGCLVAFGFDYPNAAEVRTLFTQQMLERGFLAGCGFYPTLAHNAEHLAHYEQALETVFAELADIIETGKVKEHLRGEVAHSGFKRLN